MADCPDYPTVPIMPSVPMLPNMLVVTVVSNCQILPSNRIVPIVLILHSTLIVRIMMRRRIDEIVSKAMGSGIVSTREAVAIGAAIRYLTDLLDDADCANFVEKYGTAGRDGLSDLMEWKELPECSDCA